MRHFKLSLLHPVKLFAGAIAGFFMSFGVATLVCFAMLLSHLVVPAQFASGVSDDSQEQLEFKAVGEYRKDLKLFIQKSKSKDDPTERLGAVINLCLLHEELVNDPRLRVNNRLKSFRAMAAARLKKCSKEIELELLRYEKAIAKRERDRLDVVVNTSENVVAKQPDELPFEWYAKVVSDDLRMISDLSGGPINLWKYTGNPAGPVCDYGPDLVRLIESTINPEFWRRNGGNGIIEYYQPLRILVVTASSKVHDDMSDLLNTMRKIGR